MAGAFRPGSALVRVLLVGAGSVGARAARQLASMPGLKGLSIADRDARVAVSLVDSLGAPARAVEWEPAACAGHDVVLLAFPGDQLDHAQAAIERGASVVSTGDAVYVVRRLLGLDVEARERGLSLVIGTGFSPGLSCVLARHAAADFDDVNEIHVAKVGTGGPACARQHHRALSDLAVDWRDGAWTRRPGGSGRELCWFPDPIGAVDCYRAGLPESLLLVPGFPGVERVTARLGATRRDRFTAWMPMLRRPHPEGTAGAIRVEVRGRRGTTRDVRVLGALDRPGVAAGVVAALAVTWAASDRLARHGAGGLAELIEEPVSFLSELHDRGIRAAVFEGGVI